MFLINLLSTLLLIAAVIKSCRLLIDSGNTQVIIALDDLINTILGKIIVSVKEVITYFKQESINAKVEGNYYTDYAPIEDGVWNPEEFKDRQQQSINNP